MKAVVLKCVGCGAGLDVAHGTDRLICAYCGSEQIVERQGSMARLGVASGMLSRIARGSERAASELTVLRIRQELSTLAAARARQRAETLAATNAVTKLFKVAVFPGLGAVLCWNSGNKLWALAWGSVAALIIFASIAAVILSSNRETELKNRTALLGSKLEEEMARLRSSLDA